MIPCLGMTPQQKKGWQKDAAWCLSSSRALLDSTVFVTFPMNRVTRIDAQPFRTLSCRGRRFPMPLSSRTCRCGRLSNVHSHHRAGVLKLGCWVGVGTLWSVLLLRCVDGRQLEVNFEGLPLFDGAQLALDPTMVSPIHRDGTAKRGASARIGGVLQDARRRKERTYPELNGAGGRARLVVLGAEVGGQWSEETALFFGSGLAEEVAESACLQRRQSVRIVTVGQETASRSWWRHACLGFR